jgi:hypothetical protein
MVEVTMPPTMGAAIGFMTSEPMPDSQRIGMRLARTAQTVMSKICGRSRKSFSVTFWPRWKPCKSARTGWWNLFVDGRMDQDTYGQQVLRLDAKTQEAEQQLHDTARWKHGCRGCS